MMPSSLAVPTTAHLWPPGLTGAAFTGKTVTECHLSAQWHMPSHPSLGTIWLSDLSNAHPLEASLTSPQLTTTPLHAPLSPTHEGLLGASSEKSQGIALPCLSRLGDLARPSFPMQRRGRMGDARTFLTSLLSFVHRVRWPSPPL